MMNVKRTTKGTNFWKMGAEVMAITAMVCAAHTQAAQGQVVLSYDGADATLPASVVDSSGNSNDGAVVGDAGSLLEGVTIVLDAPAEFPGGSSFAFDSTNDRIDTNAIDLLDNASVVAAGGFTMDVWIKTELFGFGLGTSASVIDYAGTERIQFNTDFAVTMRISNAGPVVVSTVNVTDNEWHHVTAKFAVTDGSNLAAVVGDMTLTVDDVTEEPLIDQTLTDFGDTLDRPIGIGGHPIGFSGDIYEGLIFNPSVSLGTGANPGVLGDANGDGSFDFGDIEAFFLAITDLPVYMAQYPTVAILLLDMNSDGNTDFGDIDAFFVALTAG